MISKEIDEFSQSARIPAGSQGYGDASRRNKMTEAYRIAIPHFWCLEYYEGNKKMTVDIDFRDEKYYLNTKLISSWEAPFENEIITNDEKGEL